MTKFITILFSGILIMTSLIGLGLHDAEYSYIVGFSKPWIVGRLLLAFFLLFHNWLLPIGKQLIIWSLRLLSVALFYCGLSSLLFGSRASGLLIPYIDIVLLIEGGIVACLASLEVPEYERSFTNLAVINLSSLTKRRVTQVSNKTAIEQQIAISNS